MKSRIPNTKSQAPLENPFLAALWWRPGLTLLELVIALGIAALVAVAVFGFQRDYFQLNRLVGGGLEREAEIRQVLKDFSAEVRSAQPSSLGAYPIETASSVSFAFFTDADGDALKERVRYFLAGTILKKGILKPTGNPLTYNPLSEVTRDRIPGVTGPAQLFSYFDAAYDGTALPLAEPLDIPTIRMVRLTLDVDPNGSKPPGAVTYTTQATPRNLRSQ